MLKHNLQSSFINFCKVNKFEINKRQIEIINLLDEFIKIDFTHKFNVLHDNLYSLSTPKIQVIHPIKIKDLI